MSSKITTESFMETIEKINPNIEIIGEYINARTPILVRCKKCGHEWTPIPDSIKRGHGCIICSNKETGVNKRKVHAQFYEEMAELHPEIEVLGEYLKSNSSIKVKCRTCGYEWNPTPHNLLSGKGCPECAKVNRGLNKRISYEEFLRKFRESNPNYKKIDIIGSYTKVTDNITCKCKICGNVWSPLAYSLLQGCGCKFCSAINAGQTRRKNAILKMGTLSQTHPLLSSEWNYEKNGDLMPENFAPNSTKKVWWKCAKCGYEWEAIIAQRVGNNSGCKKCNGQVKKTNEEFISEINKISPNIQLLSEYINAKSSIKCKCLICGHEWTTTGNKLQQGSNCDICARKVRADKNTLSKDEFLERIKSINPNIKILSDYIKQSERIYVECKKCGNKWNPTAMDLLHGNGCPNCNHSSTSYVEKYIYESFALALGKDLVKARDKTETGKELDIFIPSRKIAFEPGSWTWHKNLLTTDQEKINICKKSNIELYVIYDSCKGLFSTDDPHYIIFDYYLGDLKHERDLINLVLLLFEKANIQCSFSIEDWKNISNRAYLSSRKTSTEDFINRVKLVNNKVEIIGEYTSFSKKILVKCKRCNEEYYSLPGHLLEGKGHFDCYGRKQKTNSEFVEELKKINPSIMPKEPYLNSKTKIQVKCNSCGHIWSASPSNLLTGYGCPKCKIKDVSKKLSKKVFQYSIDGKLLNTFQSVSDASNKTGISKSTICTSCNKENGIGRGYIWKYKEDNTN